MTHITTYNNDCLQLLATLPKARLLLTDIPYCSVNRNDNGLRNLDKGKADIGTFNLLDFLKAIYDKADIFIIFCGNEQYSFIYDFFNKKSSDNKGTTRQLIYTKSNPSPMNGEYVYLNATENAVWFKKKGTGKLNSKCKRNVFNFPTGSSKHHPTEKNHKLLADLILDNTDENDIIIDPCMGSGSTGIVASSLKRRFIGIEIDNEFYNIAVDRLSKL